MLAYQKEVFWQDFELRDPCYKVKGYLETKITGLKLPVNLATLSEFEDIEHFMRLFILLYADDTAILTETPSDMQKSLDALSVYCTVKVKFAIEIVEVPR